MKTIDEQDFNYIKPLIDLGMKAQEARVYLAAIKLGQATVSAVANEAGIQRTFVYGLLEELQKQGIVSSAEIRGKIHYSPISLDQFQKRQFAKFEKFEAILPELKSLEKTVGDRPKVRFFEGAEGIKTALYDSLDTLKAGDEIIAYANAEGFYENELEFSARYIKERIKRKIRSRAIAADTPETRKYSDEDEKQLRKTILVPADQFPFTNEIDIYGNKVAIMSLQGELLAIIIESESVAKTQRAIFELAWLGAKSLNK